MPGTGFGGTAGVKILVVHQYYLLPGRPGGSRFNEMCRSWSDKGHAVTVIAGTVDYTTGSVPEVYRGRWTTEEADGEVKVIRCHVPATYSKSYLGRMWAFFGFTLSASTAALHAERADVVIATSPPLIAVLPGWIAARCSFTPCPWIFEIRDLWPESAVTTGVIARDALLTRILYRLEKWACTTASKVNVLTPAFRDDLIRRGLASEEKIAFIPNGADLDRFVPGPRDNSARREFGWGDRFVAMYSGAHGRANAVDQLLKAADLLKDRHDILIACVGDGTERKRLEAEAKLRGITNIQFAGAHAKEKMPEIVNGCDVGMAVLQSNPTFRTVYPNKVFDYMSCARPVLIAIDGVARELVCQQADAGIFAEPENAQAISEALRRLADDPALCAEFGRKGRQWVLANAGREALADRYLEVMTDLVKPAARGTNAIRSAAKVS